MFTAYWGKITQQIYNCVGKVPHKNNVYFDLSAVCFTDLLLMKFSTILPITFVM